MNHHGPVGPRNGREHGFAVPWLEAAQVDHLDLDALAGQFCGRRQRSRHRAAIGDDRGVTTTAGNARLANLDDDTGIHRPLAAVQGLVLDEDHRIRIVDRGAQQAVGVRRRGGTDDLQAGHMGEPCLQALRVLRAGTEPAAMRCAQHHGHTAATPEHEPRLRCLIDQRIHGQGHEVHEHDLDHRLESRHRGPDRHRGDGGFGDRRVTHAHRAKLIEQTTGRLEGAASCRNVLAQ